MEREITSISIRLKPAQFVALCRCVKDDFFAYAQACEEDPYEDHADDLDRMEEDLDLLESALPKIKDASTEDAIALLISEFKGKIDELSR